MFIILIVVMISREYIYFKTHQTIHLKYVPFTVCQLHFTKIVIRKMLMDQIQIGIGKVKISITDTVF